jgi:hypothetical protein
MRFPPQKKQHADGTSAAEEMARLEMDLDNLDEMGGDDLDGEF